MIPFDSKEAVIALKEIKKQTGFSNLEIAEMLDMNGNTVASWLNQQNLPNPKSCKKIKTFIEEYGVPGIVELPPNDRYWTAPLFLRVADIDNPFFTWYVENSYTGNYPEDDYKMMEDYYQKYLQKRYLITTRLIYPDKHIAQLRGQHDIDCYAFTIKLLQHNKPYDVFSSEYNQIVIAPDIIKEKLYAHTGKA